MLLYLKTLLKLLILPPAGLLILAMAGAVLQKRRPKLGRIFLLLSLGSLWLLSTPVVSDSLSRLAERYPEIDLSRAAEAQAIVILGGGGQRTFAPEYGGPAADPEMLERLSYGAYLARKTGLPVLLTGHLIEAVAMHDTLLRNFGIEARWIDDQAYDTFQNASNSARILQQDGVRNVILVTHSTHLWRAAQEFSATGLRVLPAPTGLGVRNLGPLRFVPNGDALSRACLAVNELVGEPVREFLAASHLRRHVPPRLSGGDSPSQR
jgi:uncharacterized SAM-binding protein YcdF (DUF218 family)